jgi:hypothetical protein
VIESLLIVEMLGAVLKTSAINYWCCKKYVAMHDRKEYEVTKSKTKPAF